MYRATDAMGTLSNLWNRKPVAVQGLVQATLAVAVSFGLGLTSEQVGAILALSAAVLTVVTQQKVSAAK